MARILFIGDSILEGMAPHVYRILDDGRHGSGEARIDARSGWSTRRWLNEGELRAIVAAFRPSTAVVALGTNDEGEEANPTSYAERVVRLRDQAAELGAQVIWVTGFSGSGLERRLRIVQGALGARATIDGAGLMPGVSMSGEIHPSEAGYRVLSFRFVTAVFDRIGSEKPRASSPVVPVLLGAGLAAAALAAWRL